ncbi:hypothetical protein [Natrarchaeobaculum sulfurireducens]|uniref:Uncharacterized protein n=1 Tax=Natrarchaeobaculum sulfurireducens TaxID=2044521 RepID=A0A346PCQ0_9EURY|nr:hypothetical protein [Natrarchaeobaculum sulfurireducens]AXR77295.1 hypothetical protein AArc1_0954 [Natrarchaeobaculum sulfurireducens]AXR82742.1 hypothetical protein AArcMg_2752 [Natrarchaeobaculum sulfurireducens]
MGPVGVFAPIAETETQQWGVVGPLVLAWLVLAELRWNAAVGYSSHCTSVRTTSPDGPAISV